MTSLDSSALGRSARRLGLVTAITALTTATTGLGAGSASATPQPPGSSTPGAGLSTRLAKEVTLSAVNRHLVALQRIADANGGNRASGSSGFDASAAYVAQQLGDAGLQVTTQEFDFPFFEETAAPALARTSPSPRQFTSAELATLSFSGSGDVSAPVVPVDVTVPAALTPSSTSGCEAADFAGFPSGAIALVQRGTCDFGAKAANAVAAGAAAVLVFNEGQEGRTELLAGTLGAVSTVPVVGLSYADGAEFATLAASGPVTAALSTATTNEVRTTSNVLAETRGGRADNVVMLGAHLDSVSEGPGINDNGSGTASILEVARQLADEKVTNKVRFAFWGAEEAGLLGSEAYVDSLSFQQQLDIALYLNFDMVGSPNFARFLYDGDDSDAEGAGPGPFGSAQIEQALKGFWDARGLPTEGTDFDGRSDYGPFIAAGIPAGGSFTGAEGIKTAEQAQKYGGTAGVAYDPNYHAAGDTLANLDRAELDRQADSIATVTGRYATSTAEVNFVSGKAKKDSQRVRATRASAPTPAAREAAAGDGGEAVTH